MPRRRQPPPESLPSTPSTSRSPSPARDPEPIDTEAFPHIWAAVLAANAPGDVHHLRGVSRALRAQVDTSLARHVIAFEAHNTGVVDGQLDDMLEAAARAKARVEARIATGKLDEARSSYKGRRERRAIKRMAQAQATRTVGAPTAEESSSDSDSTEGEGEGEADMPRPTRSTVAPGSELARYGYAKYQRAVTEAYRAHQVQLYTVLPAPPGEGHARGARGAKLGAQHHRYVRSNELVHASKNALVPFYHTPADAVLGDTRVLDILGCPPLAHIADLLPHLDIVRFIPHPDLDDDLLRRPAVGRRRDGAASIVAGKAQVLQANTVVLFMRPMPDGDRGERVLVSKMGVRRIVAVVPPIRAVLTPNGYAVPAFTGPRYDVFQPPNDNNAPFQPPNYDGMYALWKHGDSECPTQEIVYIFTGEWLDVELMMLQDTGRFNRWLGLLHACFHQAHVDSHTPPNRQPHILVGVEAIPARLLRLEDEYEVLRTTDVEAYYAALMDMVVDQFCMPEPDLGVGDDFEQLLDSEKADIVRSVFTFMTHEAYRDVVGEQTYTDYTAAYDWV
ncbi:hypothetical protein Q8F55_008581 [Vanrija albida]|uniref:F-box domain-containing protein n=1 Tax=Vanrija albida TaxID=181172 RepID=A0ABR3PR86_9TREE